MNDNELNRLTRETRHKNKNTSNSKIYYEMKKAMKDICTSMLFSTKDYNPENTISLIKDIILSENENKGFRILYSELNTFLMSLDTQKKGIFDTNAEVLLLCILDQEVNSNQNIDIIKIIIKIYDHSQLINAQVKNLVTPQINDMRKEIRNDIKVIEREYITILGIFAAIILAFVGAFTFSTSVLNNIDKASLLKLSCIAFLIGCVFYKLISLLINFLYDINEKQRQDNHSIITSLLNRILGKR